MCVRRASLSPSLCVQGGDAFMAVSDLSTSQFDRARGSQEGREREREREGERWRDNGNGG